MKSETDAVPSVSSLAEMRDRLVSVWRKRGIRKFILFVGGRLLRLQRDIIYRRDSARCSAEQPVFEALRLCRVGADHPPDRLARGLQQQLFALEDSQYREELYRDDLLFAVLDTRGRVIHHSYVFYRSSYKHLLGLEQNAPLIGNCETIEAWRGLRIFPRVLTAIALYLTEYRQCRYIYTSCAPGNIPSIKGMEKAEFEPYARVASFIILNRYVVQKVTIFASEKKWRIFDLKNPRIESHPFDQADPASPSSLSELE